MNKVLYFVAIVFLIGMVAACDSLYEKEPVGIGKDYSELKKSPCSCLELKLAPELPSWFS